MIGRLIWNQDRPDIIFDTGALYGGLHCGDCFACWLDVRSSNNAELAAVLREFPQLVHDKPQTAPFDEGHQHIDPIGRDDFLFELCKHLRLMHGSGEKRALCDGGLWADDLSPFVQC